MVNDAIVLLGVRGYRRGLVSHQVPLKAAELRCAVPMFIQQSCLGGRTPEGVLVRGQLSQLLEAGAMFSFLYWRGVGNISYTVTQLVCLLVPGSVLSPTLLY